MGVTCQLSTARHTPGVTASAGHFHHDPDGARGGGVYEPHPGPFTERPDQGSALLVAFGLGDQRAGWARRKVGDVDVWCAGADRW